MVELPNMRIDKDGSHFLLTGDIRHLLENKRLYFSLKRLHFQEEEGHIAIPFENETEIATLQEIQEILQKFGIRNDISDRLRTDTESFDRERVLFSEFSEKARDIRDNKFKDKPELVKEFDSFSNIVRTTLPGRRLYDLQLLSAFHMAFAQNACNFAVPGAGKTSIVYAAYAYLKNLPEDDPRHVDKLLVIGPPSSFAPWEREYQECFSKKPEIQRLSGDGKISRTHKEEHLFSGNPAELTLIFHGGVERLQEEILSFLKRNKTMVVVDEAHRIKNPEGVWGKSIVEIGKEARSRIILTGTPVPNGYEDLFNLYQYLYPYKFKDILRFHYGNLIDMTKNSDPDGDRVHELIRNISPYFIRIKKSDLKLPPVKDTIIEVPMNNHQREIYDFIETKYIKSFRYESSANVKDVLNKAKLIRLRQAATNPALLQRTLQETLNTEDYEERIETGGEMPEEFQEDSQILAKIRSYSKLEAPAKFIMARDLVIEKINLGEKVIIWTIFVQNAKELQKYLADNGIQSELLIGEVEQSDRESIIEIFNDPNNESLQVLIANPFSVAESISLHKGCHNAVYLERDYNCSNFLQSKDRIHRVGLLPGQETNYYYLISKDSIDTVIHSRLDDKVRRMEQIINQDIPLFSRINDADETDLIKALIDDYAGRA
jgi:SNF2 family DNA or RNA helicase